MMLAPFSAMLLFCCCVLAAYLVLARSEARTSNLLFAAFLVLTAFETSGWYAQSFWAEHLFANRFRFTSAFLQMPMFFGFVAAACFRSRRVRLADWPHLLPWMVASVLAIALSSGAWAQIVGVLTAFLHLQFFAYAAACVLVLTTFRQRYLAEFSDAGSQTFLWLSRLVAVSVLAHLLVVTKNAAMIAGVGPNALSILQQLVALVALLVVSAILMVALFQPDTFRGVDRRSVPVGTGGKAAPRQSFVGDLERVRSVMRERELFLKPDLRVDELALEANLTPRELSALLNLEAGVHFFDFVNQYRIEQAKILLVAAPEKTVAEIMLAAGFVSKSSFNTAFRKLAKTTPSAFRLANKVKAEQYFAESRTSEIGKPNDTSRAVP
ncbi:AraC family transcriptional regulator [Parvularcula sp. ZS-1/3]|uniref:AraC family transcriptional regulator n=1 Tax=Parvularcula mediterranea TaxID=2732508 RepID=A0A7Y3RPU7_9PROT|nr:helix-turn-helix domain-containing protein [Parvularcula mediterranea]NNU17516.1 AraC family transcriptional regulator [Parvularcula mediterranea]